jgi:hypothetical protein
LIKKIKNEDGKLFDVFSINGKIVTKNTYYKLLEENKNKKTKECVFKNKEQNIFAIIKQVKNCDDNSGVQIINNYINNKLNKEYQYGFDFGFQEGIRFILNGFIDDMSNIVFNEEEIMEIKKDYEEEN